MPNTFGAWWVLAVCVGNWIELNWNQRESAKYELKYESGPIHADHWRKASQQSKNGVNVIWYKNDVMCVTTQSQSTGKKTLAQSQPTVKKWGRDYLVWKFFIDEGMRTPLLVPLPGWLSDSKLIVQYIGGKGTKVGIWAWTSADIGCQHAAGRSWGRRSLNTSQSYILQLLNGNWQWCVTFHFFSDSKPAEHTFRLRIALRSKFGPLATLAIMQI